MTRTFPPILALSAALVLSACLGAPNVPMTRPAPGPVATPIPAPMPDMAGAGNAEQACIAAGQERGLQVLGVSGSRPADGAVDVMLRVARGPSQLEVRCNYQTDTDMARIMLI